MIEKNIIFICDRVTDHKNATISSKDLEKPASNYYSDVLSALKKIASSVICYSSPDEFQNNIMQHKDAIVLSLWSGESSRNRRALIPSICEAYNIPYVGADPYIQTICADKHLSKNLCVPYGIKVARDVTVTSTYDYFKLKQISYPAVVKPNFEGGSIGIFNENLVDNYYDAIILCEKLLPFYSSLLVEEYLNGYEVSVCIAGISQKIDLFQVVKVSVNGKDYFDHDILGAEAKKMGLAKRVRVIDNNLITPKEKEILIDFYNSLGKVEVMRIDGRVNENGFSLIELTPDCSLSKTGSIALAFSNSGYSYEKMFEHLINNALYLFHNR